MNDECELYKFSLHTIRELHTNHELHITNREYAHSLDRTLIAAFVISKYS